MECPNGICDRLQIAEWDVQTLINERDAAIAAATMPLRQALRKADAEVTALADALRAAGVAAPLVQGIIDEAKPREPSDVF